MSTAAISFERMWLSLPTFVRLLMDYEIYPFFFCICGGMLIKDTKVCAHAWSLRARQRKKIYRYAVARGSLSKPLQNFEGQPVRADLNPYLEFIVVFRRNKGFRTLWLPNICYHPLYLFNLLIGGRNGHGGQY